MACEETKKIACNGRLKKENWDKREKIEGKLCLLLNALILTQILVLCRLDSVKLLLSLLLLNWILLKNQQAIFTIQY